MVNKLGRAMPLITQGQFTHKKLAKEHQEKKRICKICGREKSWIFIGRLPIMKYYKDEEGKRWMGKFCNDCWKKRHGREYRVKLKMRKNILHNILKKQKEAIRESFSG